MSEELEDIYSKEYLLYLHNNFWIENYWYEDKNDRRHVISPMPQNREPL